MRVLPDPCRVCVAVAVTLISALFLGSGTSLAAEGDQYLPTLGGPGGGSAVAECPPRTYLVGFAANVGDDFDSIEPLCAGLRLDGSRSEVFALDRYGGPGGNPQPPALCPPEAGFVKGIAVSWEGMETIVVNTAHVLCLPMWPQPNDRPIALGAAGPIGTNETTILDDIGDFVEDVVDVVVSYTLTMGTGAWGWTYMAFDSETRRDAISTTANVLMYQQLPSERPPHPQEGWNWGQNAVGCLPGMTAGGLTIRAGLWLDAVGIVCRPTPPPPPTLSQDRPLVRSDTVAGAAQPAPRNPIAALPIQGRATTTTSQAAEASAARGAPIQSAAGPSVSGTPPGAPRETELPDPSVATSARAATGPTAPTDQAILAASGATTPAQQAMIRPSDTPLQQSGSVIQGPADTANLEAADQIVCRGFADGTKFATGRFGSAPDETEIYVLFLPPTTSQQAAGLDGAGLAPGRCGLIDRPWPDAGSGIVRFKVPRQGAGEAVDALVTHLSDPGRYWRFFSVKDPQTGYYEANRHAEWQPAAATVQNTNASGGRQDLGRTGPAAIDLQRSPTDVPVENQAANATIARLYNVQVTPRLDGASFRFIARPDAAPVVEFSREVPVVGRDGLMVLRSPRVVLAQRDATQSNAAVTWYAADTLTGRGMELPQNTSFHYIITVPGDGSIPIQQEAGTFTTLQNVLTVTFRTLRIDDDSDDLSDGEGAFTFCVTSDSGRHERISQTFSRFETAGQYSVSRRGRDQIVFEGWEDGPVDIVVHGLDDDTVDGAELGAPDPCTQTEPRGDINHENVARVRIDTRNPQLGGPRGATAMQIQSLPPPDDDGLEFSASFELEVARPGN
jgi:hypothetical protein